MSNWFGSHWRWRVAMLLIAVALIGYGRWQAGRWKWRKVVESGGTPAIYRAVHRDGSQSIEAFDWKSGRRWTITTIAPYYRSDLALLLKVVPGSEAIAWQSGGELHVVDIQPPHRERIYRLPSLSRDSGLVRVTSDLKFAIFQSGGGDRFVAQTKTMRRVWWVGPLPKVELVVVDLESGEIVSARTWQSVMIEGENATEFESFLIVASPEDATEPTYGRWRLKNDGTWAVIERSAWFPTALVVTAKNARGEWRLVDEAHPVTMSDEAHAGVAARGLPELNRMIVCDEGMANLRVVNLETKGVWTIAGDEVTGWQVAEDGRTIAVSNRFDDILVYDILTGNVIARETSGSGRRIQLLVVAIGLLVLAVVWTRIGMKEAALAWGMFDALAGSLLVQAAVYPLESCFDLPYLHILIVWRALGPIHMLQGGMVGAAILAGWYLAHGRHWIAVRWLLGTLWLAALTVPLVLFSRGPFAGDPIAGFRTDIVIGLLMSSLAAAVAVTLRPWGWTIGPAHDRLAPWRFGLMPMFALVSSVGIAIFLFQSLLMINDSDWLFWSVGALALGVPLVGVLFLKSGWMRALGVVASLVVAIGAITWRALASGNLANPPFFIGEGITTASSVLTILIPCLVLRAHGWTWTRAQTAMSLDEPATNLTEAAA